MNSRTSAGKKDEDDDETLKESIIHISTWIASSSVWEAKWLGVLLWIWLENSAGANR